MILVTIYMRAMIPRCTSDREDDTLERERERDNDDDNTMTTYTRVMATISCESTWWR